MAGNLLGQPFDPYVNDQIIARQTLHGSNNRDSNQLRYLNGRNAWVKLASGCILLPSRLNLLKGNPIVDAARNAKDLAKSNVLFNGLSNFETDPAQQRFGITGKDRAYGVGGTDQFGYSPMPGIIDMDFKCLNRGSIKKATLNIKAHNKNQFDVIDVLYMRLGYSVLLEWGYDKYLDNKGVVKNTEETLIDKWFWSQNESSYKKVFPKIFDYRKKYNGNYDAAFGIISNFSWTFEADGTYNIKIDIISLGDIIESLKVNLPSLFLSDDRYNNIDGEAYASLLQKYGAGAVGQDDFYTTLYPGLKEALSLWWDSTYNGAADIPAPYITPGIDFRENWTGRELYDDDNKLTSVQKYSSYWEEKTVELWSKQNETLYENPNGIIDDGFKMDTEKLSAVRDAIFNLFNNGTNEAVFGPNTTKDRIVSSSLKEINSPFGDNFVKNSINYARENSTGLLISSSFFKSGQLKTYSSVVGDDEAIVYNFIPLGNKMIETTVTLAVDDPFSEDLDDINTANSADSTLIVVGSDGETLIDLVPRNNVEININLYDAPDPILSNTGSSLQPLTEDQRVEKLIRNNISNGITNPYKVNIRRAWGEAYSNLNNRKKWEALLDSRGKSSTRVAGESNFSEYLGITKNQLYKNVYEEFVAKDFADAYPKNPEELAKQEQFKKAAEEGELTESQKREKELLDQRLSRLQKDYITKDRNRIYEYFYNIRSKNLDTNKGEISLFNSVGDTSGNIGVNIKDNEILKLNIEPLDYQWYIRLGSFLDWVNAFVIPEISSDSQVPIISMDTDTEKTICYAIDNTYSLDIRKLIVRNNNFTPGVSSNNSAVVSPILKGTGVSEYVVKQDKNSYGKIMNIYFNFNRLEEIFDSSISNQTVSLFEALKTICNDINESLGNINNIEPVIREDNTVQFIDQSPIPNLKQIAKELNISETPPPKKEAKFEVYGLNYQKTPTESNFVRSIGLTTQIDKKFATMITIGATSQGSIPGIEATAFSRWNLGIEDRFKKSITDPSDKGPIISPISSSSGKKMINKYATMIGSTDDPWQMFGISDSGGTLKTVNEDNIKYSTNIVSDYYSLAQAQISFENAQGNPENPTESSIGFLPFNLRLSMDGISGIKIYNKIQIQQSFLPSNYPETLEFITTQVNHKLSDNDWVTTLETIATSKSVLKKR